MAVKPALLLGLQGPAGGTNSVSHGSREQVEALLTTLNQGIRDPYSKLKVPLLGAYVVRVPLFLTCPDFS